MWDESKLRVFLSYSRKNRDAFDAVIEVLKSLGLSPWSDQDLYPGGLGGFTAEIQTKIKHSHVFIPILTPESHKHGWVHQEIGFAVARRVPCVPLCIGKVPEGMIALAHAVVLNKDLDAQELNDKLRRVRFAQLVEQAGKQWEEPSECAQEPERRAEMIEKNAREAFDNWGACCVRMQGSLGSFSLPDEAPHHPIWAARYGNKPRGMNSYQWFRRERVALEHHARAGKLGMILNVGLDLDKDYGEGAKRTRICVLLQFLESLTGSEENARIALVDQLPPDLFLSVGDWFTAESSAARPVRGVLQTVFTVHAPSVTRRLREFDAALEKELVDQKMPPKESLVRAITRLREMIPNLPRHPAWSCEG